MSDRKSLLGKRVRVKLDSDVVTEGVLLSFGTDGEIVTQDDMGNIYYSWPALEVEAA
jgi:biotin-(acetyl-CoA carboxylase) ligase